MAIYVFPRDRQSNIPGTSVSVGTTNFTGTSSNSQKPLMIIGDADNGAPQTPISCSNISDAINYFGSGELVDAMSLAWNPNTDGNIYAGDIIAMRAQPATQATLDEGTLKFTSKDYSENANDIQVGLSDNTVTNTKRLTITYPAINSQVIYDNLGSIFSIAYIGAYAYAGIEVDTDSNGLANNLALYLGDSAANANKIASYSLGDSSAYPKANSLINAINQVSGFKASFFPTGNKNISTKYLHALTETQVPTTTGKLYLNGLEGDILNQAQYDQYVSFEYVPEGTPKDPTNINISPIADGIHVSVDPMEITKEMSNFEPINLSGASVGVDPDSWTDLFKSITANSVRDSSNYRGYYLIPLTDDESIHAEAATFATEETNSGNPIRVILGAGLNEPVEQLESRALSLNNYRVNLVGNSGNVSLQDGTVVDEPGYMIAAMVGGIASGIDVGSSITYKPIGIISLDNSFSNSELDQLDGSGVVTISYFSTQTANTFRIVDDVTTDNSNNSSPFLGEMAVGEASDFLITGITAMLQDTYFGSKITANDANNIQISVESYLSDAVNNGIIIAYDESSVAVTISGDEADVRANVYPDRTLKKMNLAVAYENYTESANNSGTSTTE